MSVSRPRRVIGAPIGLSVELMISPVLGCLRRGAARLYTTWSTWPRSCLISSMTLALTSSEKASPLTLLAYRPACSAYLWNAAVLYQPAVPGLVSVPGRSKNTPSVAAPLPKAAVIRAARP
ncbi:hypothetical protein D3C71_1754030 [compost metagenome]